MSKKGKKGKKGDSNIIAVNKKASFKFHLSDRLEAGLVLLGSEIKSLRDKKANLIDSYVVLKRGEAWLVGLHISPYSHANRENHMPRRERKLLMHKREIAKIAGSLNEKGLTLVPTKLYFKGGRAKIEIALAKGKKLFDKRETIKKRETKRSIERALKSR